jgi:hypothetical protein
MGLGVKFTPGGELMLYLKTVLSFVSDDFFDGFYENRAAKIAGVVFSAVSGVATVAAAAGIIWFERFGSDLRRIFINKMVSSVCWCILAWFTVIQIPDLVGPRVASLNPHSYLLP